MKQKIINKNISASWSSWIDYLKVNMGNMRLEQFRILFLNKKNILIADEVLSQGTIDQAAVYPREIILVHHHPSGSPEPSKADIHMTNKIAETCQTVNIIVHDHVIISNNKYYSFKSNMFL
ncbi:DNA repair protein RadC [Rickettsia montanensis str. OSU 85-930]|uniref:DNA repair protein RadC n=1 Tax=Rickettsia montanensis (strain OSU 85-930) TaxID=1105114 RepID=H8KAJ6_RICMS|nr:DNA repair protein RadC [Rickettsia montanensis str. OSU 85-930]